MVEGGLGGAGGAGMFKIAKPLVTGVAKDDRFTLSSKDYTVLTGGQSQRWGVGGMGGHIQETTCTVRLGFSNCTVGDNQFG